MYYRHLQEDAAQEDETEEDRYRFRSLQEQHVSGDMKIHGFETPKSVDRKLNFTQTLVQEYKNCPIILRQI